MAVASTISIELRKNASGAAFALKDRIQQAAHHKTEKNSEKGVKKDFAAVLSRGRRAKWIRRTGSKQRGFRYLDVNNEIILSKQQLERIKALMIPPAWTNVRICPSERGKLQAIGVDTSGRVRYRYNSEFAAERQSIKFAKVEAFGRALPKLRRKINEDIALEGYSKNKVLAVMLRLINELYIRVNSEQGVKSYKTYGVTTLRNKHLHVKQNRELHFNFVGKHHIRHRQLSVDQELAAIMVELKSLGGDKLFNYFDDGGKPQPLKPQDVNDYIRNATEEDFSAKDLRAWGATVLAAEELAEIGSTETKAQISKNIGRVVKVVAERFGNKPAVARRSYVHPIIFAAYEKGVTINEFRPRTKRRISKIELEYTREEAAVIKLLESRRSSD